ncbi:hypothetical protein PF001_g26784 [Phytophthora fragariae]|uniref:Uncharacterized protein n=1 Tax=Phytophthora fragariae TaxID=53985 RepID=A0A6A4BRI4_9STRA|nr:hypothetical protein PF001_g26784 [Phytophthora fragariae]
MARTRVVEVVVQQAKRAPDNRPANQNQEETKTDDPVDESNPSDERDEHGADETPSAAQEAPASTNDDGAAMAPGMENIGQAFVTAPDTYVVPANGTTGHMALIPGVGSTNVAEEEKLACFTNSRGFYNKYLGLWEAPKRRVWNGHMWAPLPRKRSATTAAPTVTRRVTTARPDKVPKVNMAVAAQDDSEEEGDDDQEAEADHAPPLLRNPSSQPDGRTP